MNEISGTVNKKKKSIRISYQMNSRRNAVHEQARSDE